MSRSDDGCRDPRGGPRHPFTPGSARDGALRRSAGLQGGEACVDLGELAEVLELVELRVEAGCRELGLPAHDGLLTADLVLEAPDLARRVEDVDRLDRVVHLPLRLGRLRTRDEL